MEGGKRENSEKNLEARERPYMSFDPSYNTDRPGLTLELCGELIAYTARAPFYEGGEGVGGGRLLLGVGVGYFFGLKITFLGKRLLFWGKGYFLGVRGYFLGVRGYFLGGLEVTLWEIEVASDEKQQTFSSFYVSLCV